jgi:hypothetical protein
MTMSKRAELGWDDLADLGLDPSNPRHDPGMQRRDIIAYLVGNESVLGLAKDIKDEGLSPLDVWGAIEDPQGGYIVVEGNRRLCALLLLHDPSLAPNKQRKSFEKLAEEFDPDSLPDGLTIPLAIFDSQAEADKWIERKHNGAGGGTGIRSWNATQKARHFKESDNELALALLQYGLSKGWLTSKDSADVITTITRFMSSPHVRRTGLGITTGVRVGAFDISVSRDLFDRRLSKLIADIVKRENGATSRTNAAQRKAYSEAHLETILEEPTDGEAENGDDGDKSSGGTDGGGTTTTGGGGTKGGTSSGGSKNGGSTTHPDRRTNLVPEAFSPSFESDRFKRILVELKLMTSKTPVASAMLVRVFMESIVVEYLERRNGKKYSKEDKLHLLVHAALEDIDAKRKSGAVSLSKAEAAALVVLKNKVAQGDYVYSAGYLGTVAHGLAFPDWPTLTSKWDEIEAILHYIASNAEQTTESASAGGHN